MLLVSKSTLMIKSIRNPLLLLACLMSFALLSCSKNDDGPSKSRTELLTVSAWKIASVGIDLDKVRAAADPTLELFYQLADAAQKFPVSSLPMKNALESFDLLEDLTHLE